MTNILVASKLSIEIEQLIQQHISSADMLDSASSLFQQLAQQQYHLLIIDSSYLDKMPPSFYADIQAISPNLGVLILATQHERQQAVEQLQQGVDDYLVLPINSTELMLKIERILEKQQLKQVDSIASRHDLLRDGVFKLDKATQEIFQTLELDLVLNGILAEACRVTEADLAKICLTNKQGELRDIRARVSPSAKELDESEAFFKLVQQAVLAQTAVAEEIRMGQSEADCAIFWVQINPIVFRERLLGVLALASRDIRAPAESRAKWIPTFCSQIAVAIENAYLFQNLSAAYIDLAQSREKILQSRNTLQVVFDGISDGLYILNRDLIITALNRREAERQGCQPETLVGKSYLSIDGPNQALQLVEQIKQALQTGQETTWESPRDESHPYLKDREFHIYPIRNRLAQSEQVVVFAQDVSERRRWQASLFRSANLAAVGQLAGSVAHQINNPLTVTMTNSQLIMTDTEPDSETHELAAAILKASARIQNIVTNLLGFSNQEKYFFAKADLVETIEGALALVIRSLRKAQIQVVKDYQIRPVLSVSMSHLKLVWVNLLLNARDALVDQAEQPQITIATHQVSEHEVKVAITDNGIGIAEVNMDQLFRPFFTTKPVGKGLGLGLYSAHAIIERHGGRIQASSQPRVATTFEVILPLETPRNLH